MLAAVAVFATSLMLITALRKEYEKKMVPWLYCFAAFTVFRLFSFIFSSVVNDMIFAYNIAMCLLWIIFICISFYGWLIVYSLYLELSDLTRLEDLAHLRVSHDGCLKRKKGFRFHRSLRFISDRHYAIIERIYHSLYRRFSSDDSA